LPDDSGRKTKAKTIGKKCVLVKELFSNHNLLNVLELNQQRKSEVLKEVKDLMTTKISE
jgi:hypothetical protein